MEVTTQGWEEAASTCRIILDNSIPKQWRLDQSQLPPEGQADVVALPETCGLLSVEEIEMTNQSVAGLLKAYESGQWTVEAVLVAFLKRATIGQQLVRENDRGKSSTSCHPNDPIA
jgi:amidase